MNWRFTIRIFSNDRRNPIAHTHVIENLGDVALLVDLASREGQVVYALPEPRGPPLQRFAETVSRKCKRRDDATKV
jgi:hypothetical protein